MSNLAFSPLYVAKLIVNGVYSLIKSTLDVALPLKTELGIIPAAALAQLEADNNKLGRQINKNQKSGLTDELTPLDKERDELFAEIKRVTSSYLRSSNESKKAASTTLQLFLTPYWDAATLPLNIETGVLAELMVKYKARPDLLSASQGLGIDAQFTALETKNSAFDALYLSRNTEYSEREESGSSIKPAAVASYIQFCTAIEQAANFTPNDTIIALFNKMDALRKKYHALYDGSKAAPATDTTATTTTTTK